MFAIQTFSPCNNVKNINVNHSSARRKLPISCDTVQLTSKLSFKSTPLYEASIIRNDRRKTPLKVTITKLDKTSKADNDEIVRIYKEWVFNGDPKDEHLYKEYTHTSDIVKDFYLYRS